MNAFICLCTQTQVSCNHEPHLRGNVYVQYLRQVCSERVSSVFLTSVVMCVCVHVCVRACMCVCATSGKRSVQRPSAYSMDVGMPRDSCPANIALSRNGRRPSVV